MNMAARFTAVWGERRIVIDLWPAIDQLARSSEMEADERWGRVVGLTALLDEFAGKPDPRGKIHDVPPAAPGARTITSAFKAEHRIEIQLGDDDPQPRERILDAVSQAFDVLEGKLASLPGLPVERWCIMRYLTDEARQDQKEPA